MTSTAAMAPYWSGEATAPEVTARSDAWVWLDGGGAGGGCGGLQATSPRSDRAAAADRIRWPLCIGDPLRGPWACAQLQTAPRPLHQAKLREAWPFRPPGKRPPLEIAVQQ